MSVKTAAQVPFAKKAAAAKAAGRKTTGKPVAISGKGGQLKAILAEAAAKKKNGKARKAHAGGDDDPDDRVDYARLQEKLAHGVGLINKREVVALTGVSFVTVWEWMREKKFPAAHVVIGKSAWHASEVADWLKGLPVRQLKPADKATDQRQVEAA